MTDLSPICRPYCLSELALAFGVGLPRLRRLARQHKVAPACRIGRLPVYGRQQIRRLHTLVVESHAG